VGSMGKALVGDLGDKRDLGDKVPQEVKQNVTILYKMLTLMVACLTYSWLSFNFQDGAIHMLP